MKDTKKDNNVTIDMKELMNFLKGKIVVILIFALVGGLAGVGYKKIAKVTPNYASTATVYLRSSTKLNTNSLTFSNTYSAQDYALIIIDSDNMKSCIKKLNLNYTVEELKSMITIENPTDTHMLNITVNSSQSKEASSIANELANLTVKIVKKYEDSTPIIIEKAGKETNVSTDYSIIKLAVLGAAIGFVLSAFYVFIAYALLKRKSN